jgi:DNA-binding LacI/PurR family transcriptional regulator
MLETMNGAGFKCPRDFSMACATGALKDVEIVPIQSRVDADYKRLGEEAVRMINARLTCPTLPPIRSLLPIGFSTGDSSRRI